MRPAGLLSGVRIFVCYRTSRRRPATQFYLDCMLSVDGHLKLLHNHVLGHAWQAKVVVTIAAAFVDKARQIATT